MKKGVRIIIKIFILILILLLIAIALGRTQSMINAPKYQELLKELQEAGFSLEEISLIFLDARAKFYPDVIKKIKRSRVPNYLSPKSKLLTKESLKEGMSFLQKNKETLQRVEEKYGIEKEFLTAILKIESDFGRAKGKYQVFGVFNSILYYSKNNIAIKRWAIKEIVSFLVLCKKNRFDPFEINGSWAGAIGIAQFLPSSYLNYGVDADKDGIVNLFELEDALHSIANYLLKHGWLTDKRQALYAYNRSKNYVNGVLAYAAGLNRLKQN